MKILPLLIAAMMMLAAFPAPARAAGGDILVIDDKNVYDGMDKAYQDGYVPKVKSGVATLVLPLVPSEPLLGNTITATPDLGSPSSAPFVFMNYQKTVELADNPVSGGAAVPSYLVRFDLKLRSPRYNGVYPVTVAVEAKTADGAAVSQSFISYVTITDGKDPNAAPAAPKPVSEPKVIVGGYRIEPSPAVAGEEFTATITLKNTSTTQALQNMTVDVSCDSSDFLLLNDSSTIFVGKMAKGGTADVVVRYKTGLNTAARQYSISLRIDYENTGASRFSSSGSVPVLISQAMRLHMEKPSIPSSVNAGDTIPISFQVMNLGRGEVYNVRVELRAPGLFPSGAAFIGNMGPGTAGTAEMDVFVGMKDMTEGHENDEKYGMTSGKITLVYEDDSGKEYREETEFHTNIGEPVIPAAPAAEEEKPRTAGQWWITVLVAGVIVLGLAALLVFRGRPQGRKHESD